MNTQTLWITGSKGKLGSALMKRLPVDSYLKIIGTDTDVDITDMAAVKQAMDLYKPSIVINCAAISNGQFCEENMIEAYKVNAIGARNLAIATARRGAKLIHLSTDDVFDGIKNGTMNEFDQPCAVSVYGKSKLAGETFVRELNPKHLIVRSSWVYGMGSQNEFFAKVIEHGQKNEAFDVPGNQLSTPTSVDALAGFIYKVLRTDEYGVFHASCEGECTRYEFAQTILSNMGYDPALAHATYDDASRASTVLDNLMLKITNIHYLPYWKQALKEYTDKLK